MAKNNRKKCKKIDKKFGFWKYILYLCTLKQCNNGYIRNTKAYNMQ